MSIRMLLLPLIVLALIGTLVPAVFFRLQPRVDAVLPVRGRWTGPFLWGVASLAFVVLLTLVNG
ncbi:MAG: hypothetical protein ACO1SX_17090 [Actinomycetota bacterium]